MINIVATECRPEDEKKFNDWYNNVHIPMLLKCKGLLAVTRYKLKNGSDGLPKYLAVYEFKDEKAFEDFEKSPELAAAREDVRQTWKNGLDIKWRAQYEVIKSWDK